MDLNVVSKATYVPSPVGMSYLSWFWWYELVGFVYPCEWIYLDVLIWWAFQYPSSSICILQLYGQYFYGIHKSIVDSFIQFEFWSDEELVKDSLLLRSIEHVSLERVKGKKLVLLMVAALVPPQQVPSSFPSSSTRRLFGPSEISLLEKVL